MSCPNINSPEWKSLVDALGENNAWKEFIVHGKIPDSSIYDIEKQGSKVLYSIRTKSTAQIKKGINPDNIKTDRKFSFIMRDDVLARTMKHIEEIGCFTK